MKQAMLTNDKDAALHDITFGKLARAKLTAKNKEELKQYKYQRLREYRLEADRKYTSREKFGGCSTDEEIDKLNEIRSNLEFNKM